MHDRCPPENRGSRECRVRAAPAVSCAKSGKETYTSIQVQRRQSGIPCAMVLRLIRALLGVPGFLAAVALRFSPQDFIPASGKQDHTISPSAGMLSSAQARLSIPSVHRIPLPTSVTIAIRPSCGGGMRGVNHCFLKNGIVIFSREGWTGQIRLKSLPEFIFRRGDFPKLA